MNEKDSRKYDRLILCSGELPSSRREDTLYLLKTEEDVIKVYPFTFTDDSHNQIEITLTLEQYQQLEVVGVGFPADQGEPIEIIRTQSSAVFENVLLICDLHLLESSICSLQAFYYWGIVDIGNELKHLRKENKLDAAEKLIESVSVRFTDWYRQLALALHPDRAEGKQIELRTRLTQLLFFVCEAIKSNWKGDDKSAELAALSARVDRLFELLKESEEKLRAVDEHINEKIEEYRSQNSEGAERLDLLLEEFFEVLVDQTVVFSQINQESSEEESSEEESVEDELGEEWESSDRIEELLQKFEHCCFLLEDIFLKSKPREAVEGIIGASNEFRVRSEAALQDSENLNDESVNELIKIFDDLISWANQVREQLKIRIARGESTHYFASVAASFNKAYSFFKGFFPSGENQENLEDDTPQPSL